MQEGRPSSGASAGWGPGPDAPRLTTGAVHVWRAHLDRPLEGTSPLSSGEHSRAARYRFEGDRIRWVRARTILRQLLGAYLDVDPRLVSFGEGEHGKPELLPQHAPAIADPSQLQFNLSHSGGLALYAFAIDNPVGVDLEVAGKLVDAAAIARSLADVGEVVHLAGLEEPERTHELLRVWVRTEAVLKCRGTGLAAWEELVEPFAPWLIELDAGTGSAAALAAASPPDRLETWEWGAGGGSAAPKSLC